jgi:Arc/MetJ-type ribon-helix-helix transcriptional regulator
VYLDATDGRGHYEQMQVKLPPRVEHAIDMVVGESDQYRSRQDFIRDALVHHAHRRITEAMIEDPLALHLIEQQASSDRLAMRRTLREERRRNLEDARAIVDDLVRDQDYDAIQDEMARVEVLSEDITLPEGVREEYADLWMELNDALTRGLTRKIRAKNKAATQAHSNNNN